MSPVVLYPLPKTKWKKHTVLDEDGTLGPAEPVTDIAFSTDPEATMTRILGEAGLGGEVWA